MTIRILPAIGDPDAARAVSSLLHQLPDAEPAPTVADSAALLHALAGAAAQGAGAAAAGAGAPPGAGQPSAVEALPEVVLVHERIGPTPALELIREVALRFPAVGVVLITTDAGPALFSAAMDAGARGIVGLPLGYEELAAWCRPPLSGRRAYGST